MLTSLLQFQRIGEARRHLHTSWHWVQKRKQLGQPLRGRTGLFIIFWEVAYLITCLLTFYNYLQKLFEIVLKNNYLYLSLYQLRALTLRCNVYKFKASSKRLIITIEYVPKNRKKSKVLAGLDQAARSGLSVASSAVVFTVNEGY